MAISKISATELATVADANTLVSTYSASGTTIERGETFTLPAGGTTAVSNGALRLEALKGDCTITNNGNSTLTNASGVNGTVIMRSGTSDFPAFVRNSSMSSMSTPAREDFTGDVGTFNGTINSSAIFPAGHIIQTKTNEWRVTSSYSIALASGEIPLADLEIDITCSSTSNKLLCHVTYGTVKSNATNNYLSFGFRYVASSSSSAPTWTGLGNNLGVNTHLGAHGYSTTGHRVSTIQLVASVPSTNALKIRPMVRAYVGTSEIMHNGTANGDWDESSIIIQELKV